MAFFIVGFLIYSNTFENPFVFDDKIRVFKNPAIRIEKLTIKLTNNLWNAAFGKNVSQIQTHRQYQLCLELLFSPAQACRLPPVQYHHPYYKRYSALDFLKKDAVPQNGPVRILQWRMDRSNCSLSLVGQPGADPICYVYRAAAQQHGRVVLLGFFSVLPEWAADNEKRAQVGLVFRRGSGLADGAGL